MRQAIGRPYTPLIRALRQPGKEIARMLDACRDRGRHLKHDRYAQAIASLRDEPAGVETGVAPLIRDMERPITEADRLTQVHESCRLIGAGP